MTKIANHTALVSLAVLTLGCGDNHSSAGSGVTSSKTLDSATAADVQKLCDWALGPMRVDPSPQQSCTYSAVRNSAGVSECAGLVQSCLDATEGLAGAEPTCPFSNSKLADCDLPVSDLEDCYTKAVNAARDDYENASCATPSTSAGDENAPASCTRLRDRCPRVFDDAGDPEGEPTGDYECVSGETIPRRFLCDGVADCASGEDEMCSGGDDGDGDGSSGIGDFVCNDESVVSGAYVCDTFFDCSEGEDEASCPGDESPVTDGFKCKDGELVKRSFVCDGTRDCSTGEDEATCDGGFVCKDGFDISDQWRCDTRRDCDQGEDELGC